MRGVVRAEPRGGGVSWRRWFGCTRSPMSDDGDNAAPKTARAQGIHRMVQRHGCRRTEVQAPPKSGVLIPEKLLPRRWSHRHLGTSSTLASKAMQRSDLGGARFAERVPNDTGHPYRPGGRWRLKADAEAAVHSFWTWFRHSPRFRFRPWSPLPDRRARTSLLWLSRPDWDAPPD